MFLKEAIQCWLHFHFHPPEILQQITRLNSNILVKDKPTFWKNVFDYDVWYLNDIVCANWKLMRHNQLTKHMV